MAKRMTYQHINMEQTGARLKHMLESAGYTPRMIQIYLNLSCVQPIYRWYKGLILPSVDHLFMLSKLLNVHMEDFLVIKNELSIVYDIEMVFPELMKKRMLEYFQRISSIALTVQ